MNRPARAVGTAADFTWECLGRMRTPALGLAAVALINLALLTGRTYLIWVGGLCGLIGFAGVTTDTRDRRREEQLQAAVRASVHERRPPPRGGDGAAITPPPIIVARGVRLPPRKGV